VRIPRRPITIPSGVYTHWPVNLDLGGVPLEYATAELVCRLAEPATVVFSAWPGLTPEFAFPASAVIEAPGARIVREGGQVYVTGVAPRPGVAIRVALPGGRRMQLVVLTREQALNLSKATLAGRERLVLSPADVYFNSDGIHLGSRDTKNLQAGVYPALGRIPAGFRDATNQVSTNSFADLPWWAVFKDQTLTNLIQTALTNNYDIRIAVRRVEQSKVEADAVADALDGRTRQVGDGRSVRRHQTKLAWLGVTSKPSSASDLANRPRV